MENEIKRVFSECYIDVCSTTKKLQSTRRNIDCFFCKEMEAPGCLRTENIYFERNTFYQTRMISPFMKI